MINDLSDITLPGSPLTIKLPSPLIPVSWSDGCTS